MYPRSPRTVRDELSVSGGRQARGDAGRGDLEAAGMPHSKRCDQALRWWQPLLGGVLGGGDGMTQQYLVGELSVILGEVQAAAITEVCARRARDLRLEVESAPVAVLPSAA